MNNKGAGVEVDPAVANLLTRKPSVEAVTATVLAKTTIIIHVCVS